MATFGNLVAAPGGQFPVAEYTEISYNRQRSHSQLGYLTPAEALTHCQGTTAPDQGSHLELSKILDTAQVVNSLSTGFQDAADRGTGP
jgi:hypothetical protein